MDGLEREGDPEGPDGPEDEDGLKGPKGEDDPEGPDGLDNPEGEDDPEGPNGEDDDPEGPDGPEGLEGPEGEDDPVGIRVYCIKLEVSIHFSFTTFCVQLKFYQLDLLK